MQTELFQKRVPFQQINLDDTSVNLSPVPDRPLPEPVRESIRRFGLLHPPILKEDDRGFLVVAGRKRLAAARQLLGQPTCPCLLIPAPTPPLEVLTVALEEILVHRPLTAAETAIFFARASRFLDNETAARTFLPRMGHRPSVYLLEQYLALARLEEPILAALHDGTVTEAVARDLATLPFSDRLVLFEIIDTLRLSAGNQKKITATCRELAARKLVTVTDILKSPRIAEILDHPGANQPQKAARLMAWLSEQRFPRLSRAEREFHQFIGRLGLPEGARLSHAPSFEKDTLTLSIPFPNQRAFLASWPEIRAAVARTQQEE